jgi:hypothetical protein
LEGCSQKRFQGIYADGKVDATTVDSSVRALAGAVVFMHYRDRLKQIPIKNVQAQYFTLLEGIFGNPFREMKRHNGTPSQIARSMASNPKSVKALRNESDEFNESIMEFRNRGRPTCFRINIGANHSQCFRVNWE